MNNQPTAHQLSFELVYRRRCWGQGSGPGSRESSTILYRQVLEKLIKDLNVRTFVDLGCGDWEFSRAIDWQHVKYRGIDVVPEVITSNIERYSAANIQFECADVTLCPLPDCDLLIIKDVLHHWPTEAIQQFLFRAAGHRMLLTNTYRNRRSPANTDIQIGQFRPLLLKTFPFCLDEAEVLLEYEVTENEEWKQTLLTRGDRPHFHHPCDLLSKST